MILCFVLFLFIGLSCFLFNVFISSCIVFIVLSCYIFCLLLCLVFFVLFCFEFDMSCVLLSVN